MMVTKSGWSYRQSMVVALHRWSKGRTDRRAERRRDLCTADMEGVEARLWSVFSKWKASKIPNLSSLVSLFTALKKTAPVASLNTN